MAVSQQENLALRDQQDLLMQFVARRLSDTAARDDVVQETWLRLLKYGREHPITNWPALARRIALNLIRDHFRHASRHPSVELDDNHPSPMPLQEQTLMYRQKLNLFQQALDQMPPLRREVLIARRIQGKSYDEICQEMNISRQAAEKHLTRALVQLHNALAERASVTALPARHPNIPAEADHV